MGTRNLTVVVKDGTHKIAQYGQWDGYPSGVGADILTFLADPTNVEALRSIADRVHFAAEEEIDAVLAEQAPDHAVEARLFRDACGLGRKRAIQVLEFFA